MEARRESIPSEDTCAISIQSSSTLHPSALFVFTTVAMKSHDFLQRKHRSEIISKTWLAFASMVSLPGYIMIYGVPHKL